MGARRLTATLAVLAAVLVPVASASADPLDPPPPANLVNPPSPSSNPAPVWTWDEEALTTYECHLEPMGDPASAWQACSSGDAWPLPADGDYTFGVHAVRAGFTSTETTGSYTLDTTPPAQPTIDPISSPTNNPAI